MISAVDGHARALLLHVVGPERSGPPSSDAVTAALPAHCTIDTLGVLQGGW